MKTYLLLLFLLVESIIGLRGQEALSLGDAIQLGLENNYGIQVVNRSVQIARNNNTAGAAGMLPTLGLNINGSSFNSGSPAAFIPRRLNANASIGLNWTLFDGFGMQATKARLALLKDQSEGNAAVVVETNVQAIILAYYNVLIAKEQKKVLEQTLASSRERLNYEEFRKELGASGTFETLQFRDAVLTDSTNLITQDLNLRNAARNLNLVMGVEVEKQWLIADTLQQEFPAFTYPDLFDKMTSNNNNLKNQFLTNQILRQESKIARSALYPSFGINGNVSYGQGKATRIDGREVSFSAFDYSAGFSINFNLFNGGNTKRLIRNAQVNELIGQLQEDELTAALSNDLRQAHDNYAVRKNILDIQSARITNATTNLDLAGERFQSGLISSLDFRLIQLQFLNAQLGRLRALRDLKESETELLRLTGGILVEN